jgi:hypothetical protein
MKAGTMAANNTRAPASQISHVVIDLRFGIGTSRTSMARDAAPRVPRLTALDHAQRAR